MVSIIIGTYQWVDIIKDGLLDNINTTNNYSTNFDVNCTVPFPVGFNYDYKTLQWWTYVALVAAAFAGGLLLNYAVKKLNETRIEQRFASLRRKRTPNQATQVQSPLIDIETKTPKPLENIIAKSNATGKGISLVFNKEDNLLESKRATEDLVKNSSLTAAQKSASVAAVPEKVHSHKSIVIETPEKRLLDLEAVPSKVIKSDSKIFFREPSPMRVQSVSNKPTFLGNIYKNDVPSRNRSNIHGTEIGKEENVLLDKPVKTIVNIKENRSTPSITGLLDVQNDMQEWISDIVYREIQSKEDLRPMKSGSSIE